MAPRKSGEGDIEREPQASDDGAGLASASPAPSSNGYGTKRVSFRPVATKERIADVYEAIG